MKGFITINSSQSGKYTININWILDIKPILAQEEYNCVIRVVCQGYNKQPYIHYNAKETHEEVIKLIEAAQ